MKNRKARFQDSGNIFLQCAVSDRLHRNRATDTEMITGAEVEHLGSHLSPSSPLSLGSKLGQWKQEVGATVWLKHTVANIRLIDTQPSPQFPSVHRKDTPLLLPTGKQGQEERRPELFLSSVCMRACRVRKPKKTAPRCVLVWCYCCCTNIKPL